MTLQFHARSIVRNGLFCLLIGFMFLALSLPGRAESARHEAKRIHKIQNRLAKCRPGTYLRIVLVDHSQVVGTVGELGGSTFAFTNAENNATQRYAYADVAGIEKGETYVGEGSVHRRLPRLLIAGIAGAAAAGAIAAFTVTQ